MALPMKQASDLASMMAKKGIPGSITMAKPLDKSGDDSDDADMSEQEDDGGVESICSDLADTLSDGDADKKDKIMSLLGELVDRLKSDDQEQDEGMGSSDDSQ